MNKMKFIVFILIVLFIVDVSMFAILVRSLEHIGTNKEPMVSNEMTSESTPITIHINHGELMIIDKKSESK